MQPGPHAGLPFRLLKLAVVAAAVASLVVLVWGSGRALAAGYAVVEYQGTATASEPEDYGPSTAIGSITTTVSWDATATVDFNTGAPAYWNFTTLTGTQTVQCDGSPACTDCSTTLSEAPGDEQGPSVEQDPSGEPGPGYVLLQTGLQQLVVDSSDQSGDSCTAMDVAARYLGAIYGAEIDFGDCGSPGQQAALTNAVSPQVTDPPGGPWNTPFDFSDSIVCPSDTGPGTWALSISSSLTVNSSASGEPPPPPPCSDASSTAHAAPHAGSDQSCCNQNIFYMDLWPTCTPVKPKKPDKKAKRVKLEADVDFYTEQAKHVCAQADRFTTNLYYETAPVNVTQAEREFVADLEDECISARAKVDAAMTALKNDPPDSRYTQIALPEPWPGPAPRAVSCKRAKGRAACERLVAALKGYSAADKRAAEIWEALAVTADRWGSAYAAFSTDPNAPVGLALQTALSKAYYGELAQALAAQAKAAKTVDRALGGVGLGQLSFTKAERRKANALLKNSEPPSWLVNWMVSNGTATSAASVRAAWRALLKGAKVPASVNLKSLFSGGGSVPQIPGETYGSITIDDLYWIADAVPDTAGRDALTGYVTDAREATSASARRAALEQFLTYAKQHETGQLSILLQTAVAPLLG